MRCLRCDADTPEGAKFCIECGTSLRARCPQCGADVYETLLFPEHEYAFKHALTQAAAYRDLGHVYLCKGDLERAIPVLERGLAVCRTTPISHRRLIPHYGLALGRCVCLGWAGGRGSAAARTGGGAGHLE